MRRRDAAGEAARAVLRVRRGRRRRPPGPLRLGRRPRRRTGRRNLLQRRVWRRERERRRRILLQGIFKEG